MNEHKNIITIEDEIKEFSDKPVKSSALFKALQNIGGGGTGREVFSGTASSTANLTDISRDDFAILPRFNGSLNGEPIQGYFTDSETEIGCYSDNYEIIFIDDDGDILVESTGEECEVVLTDNGPKFITIHALYQSDAVYITEIRFWTMVWLVKSGCGLGLMVENAESSDPWYAYSPIMLSAAEDGSSTWFYAKIMIGGDDIDTWTIDDETGTITGSTGGSNDS